MTAAACLVAAPAIAAAAAQAAPVTPAGGLPRAAGPQHYVALGDSFSAGVGTLDTRAEAACYRSPLGFPGLIGEQYGWSVDDQSCSGATATDVVLDQIGTLTRGTDAVSVTVGGNDVGFAPVMTVCALPSWLGDCGAAVRSSVALARTVLPSRLTVLYSMIRIKAPRATVVAAGYPALLGPRDCDPVTFFSADDITRVNAAVDVVDGVIQDRAELAGVRFVDVRPAFRGHASCDAVPWITNLTWPLRDSFHPNRAGHQAYAATVGPALSRTDGQRIVMPLPGRATSGNTNGPGLTAAQLRQLPALADLLVEPKNVARAQRAGIPVATVHRLEKGLRGGPGAAMGALRELHALDRLVENRLR